MFPALSPDMAEHSARVAAAVRARIQAGNGWLAFDEYLRLVLYAPGLGYYSAGAEKFGPGGDYVTAPEISALFGHGIARQCAQVLEVSGGGVLELGAGSGALAESILMCLQEMQCLPAHYDILEISADLRQRQQQRLAALPASLRACIRWLDALPTQPVSGVILANEVADALPFKRFVIGADAVLERGVGLSPSGHLIEFDRAADVLLSREITRIATDLPDAWTPGLRSEVCLLIEPWIAALSAALARGTLLLVDYGSCRREYYHPQRAQGTVRCHFRHRAHDDVLLYPGLQDITAWVDFTRVAEAATAAGLTVSGYATQAAFLLANGIEQELASVAAPVEHAKLASQARMLLLPGEMGESFKVIALTRGVDAPLRGFAYQDLRGRL
ncbi:MAG TPA: SAM-dependent methyltransferase [Steroidobacteraceae bacterium]|jgi:SAM-dependent MidA family methyltransferase|nr:SAM-dependent methyltransferase [Steroidobacteraceae bacterium]